MHVNMKVKPSDGGNGPTDDMGVLKFSTGFERLYGAHGMPLTFHGHRMQHCVHLAMSQHGRPDEAILGRRFFHEYLMGEIMEKAKKLKAKFLWLIRGFFFLLTSQKISRAFPILKGFNLMDKSLEEIKGF
ncbi:hypothetical protein TNIN_277861 [Trichonephila inaurata madagascariensis]|uniref:Uncharacterized protein n=1 Tax=Trichonephila inaurata madagascariensis TaxID=2747483 RepID=A0A8X7BW35_9ARAC|nr:hypothetical protein TNIN_277861 [Trichonephila inaurata madagascariensis]